jgi:hypothetical protein
MATPWFWSFNSLVAHMSELYDRHPVQLADGQLGWEVCHRGVCRQGHYLPRVINDLELALAQLDSSNHHPVPGVNL